MTDQVDMSAFIEARSDQLNADDLLDQPRTITITRVSGTGNGEQPVAVHYDGENGRPFMPCKTVRRIMVGVWGKDASKYVGRSMTLFRDPAVAFGGMQVGGIRVSHMSHIEGEKTLALMVTRGRKAPFKVLPLATKAEPADERAVALKAITDAAELGTAALETAWKQKWMAPHREALQADLDRLKAVAAGNDASVEPETPAVDDAPAAEPEQSADAHPGTAKADALIALVGKQNSVLGVSTLLAEAAGDIQAMLPADRDRVNAAGEERKDAIRAKETEAAK